MSNGNMVNRRELNARDRAEGKTPPARLGIYWNYRVVKFDDNDLTIAEVQYNKDGTLRSFIAVAPESNRRDWLLRDVKRMVAALDAPALDFYEFPQFAIEDTVLRERIDYTAYVSSAEGAEQKEKAHV
jgi:hypothetical protein